MWPPTGPFVDALVAIARAAGGGGSSSLGKSPTQVDIADMLANHTLERLGGAAIRSAFPLVRFALKDPLRAVAALDDAPFRGELGDSGVVVGGFHAAGISFGHDVPCGKGPRERA